MPSIVRPTAAKKHASLVLLTMCLGVFIAALDTSVVNLAVKQIGAALEAEISQLQWVLDAYNLVYASFLLTGGTLGDLYGRRRLFMLGIAAFALGSLVCGFAPNGEALIAGRALTGLGAALELPASLAIVTIAFPDPKERTHAIGIWASCNGLAIAIGPTVGGMLVDAAGWRSVFLLIVPAAILALVMAFRAVPESVDPKDRQLDLLGQTFAILSLAALAFAVIEGPHWGWISRTVLLCGVVSLVSAVAFVARQLQTGGALVSLALFGNRAFSAAMAVAAMMTFGMYAMLFLMPLYLQSVRGASAVLAGLELAPMSVIFVLISRRSGALAECVGPRAMMTVGMAFMGIGLLLVAYLLPEASPMMVQVALAIVGVGLGLNTGPVMSVAVANVPLGRAGTASGLINTARLVGATFGVAALGAVFAVYAGPAAYAAEGMAEGLRAAFLGGGACELCGAMVAFAFIRRNSLAPISPHAAISS